MRQINTVAEAIQFCDEMAQRTRVLDATVDKVLDELEKRDPDDCVEQPERFDLCD